MALTADELRLIGRHLTFYRALDLGLRTPETESQRNFVEVCRGQRPAATVHEIVYMKFKRLREGKPSEEPRSGGQGQRKQETKAPGSKEERSTRTTRGGATGAIGRGNIHLIDPRAPKPWTRRIEDPLGSREDFKKDSARNRSRGRRPG